MCIYVYFELQAAISFISKQKYNGPSLTRYLVKHSAQGFANTPQNLFFFYEIIFCYHLTQFI